MQPYANQAKAGNIGLLGDEAEIAPDSLLEDLIKRLDELRITSSELSSRIMKKADRLFGSSPEVNSEGQGLGNNFQIETLQYAVEELRREIFRVADQFSRFSSL